MEDINLERRLLNHIMEHISEKSNYLIDDNIQKLLLPYTTENNIIIRLDNVFQVRKMIVSFFFLFFFFKFCERTKTMFVGCR